VWEIARFLRREPMILEVVLQHRLTSDSVVTCDLESSHANTFSVHHHWQCWQVDSLLVWTQSGLDTSRGGVGWDVTWQHTVRSWHTAASDDWQWQGL